MVRPHDLWIRTGEVSGATQEEELSPREGSIQDTVIGWQIPYCCQQWRPLQVAACCSKYCLIYKPQNVCNRNHKRYATENTVSEPIPKHPETGHSRALNARDGRHNFSWCMHRYCQWHVEDHQQHLCNTQQKSKLTLISFPMCTHAFGQAVLWSDMPFQQDDLSWPGWQRDQEADGTTGASQAPHCWGVQEHHVHAHCAPSESMLGQLVSSQVVVQICVTRLSMSLNFHNKIRPVTLRQKSWENICFPLRGKEVRVELWYCSFWGYWSMLLVVRAGEGPGRTILY